MNGEPILQLVDVTLLAQEAGLPIDPPETALTSWLESWTTSPTKAVPVYFTQALWEALGGSGADDAAYHERAIVVLKAAKETLAKVIAQHAWRSWLEAEWNAEFHRLWLIINHRYSDGIAIGFGSGDFW